MSASPVPSLEETRANQCFDALLWALSRPGQIRNLPGAGEDLIAEALLDRECRVHCADPVLMSRVLATGALVADISEADHLFLGHLKSAEILAKIRQGSDLYPDDGATLILRASLGQSPDTALRLTGAGIETHHDIQVGGLPDGFWQTRQELIRYPMGFELFLIDGDTGGGRVLGIPRSTQVEVL